MACSWQLLTVLLLELIQLHRCNRMHVPLQVLTDYFAEDADVAFGIPEDSLLEIGLPYRLH